MTHEHMNHSDDQLAVLFKTFGETASRESQLSESQREQLIDRIVCALENQPVAEVHKTNRFEKKRWGAAIVASSVILLLAFVCFWPTFDHPFPPLPMPVQSFAEEHRDQMQIALEHEAIMGRPLAWYAEQGNDVQFALLPDDAADCPSRVVFAELRIERLHQEPETCFVMIRDNQPLELYSKDGSTLKLLLWLYPVEDNLFAYQLAVDSEKTSGLIRAEDIEQPFDFQDHGVEYHVFFRVHSA